jgi:hypothetical protein
MNDFANSAFATTILAVIFNQYFATVVARGREESNFLGSIFTVLLSSLFLSPSAWRFLLYLPHF